MESAERGLADALRVEVSLLIGEGEATSRDGGGRVDGVRCGCHPSLEIPEVEVGVLKCGSSDWERKDVSRGLERRGGGEINPLEQQRAADSSSSSSTKSQYNSILCRVMILSSKPSPLTVSTCILVRRFYALLSYLYETINSIPNSKQFVNEIEALLYEQGYLQIVGVASFSATHALLLTREDTEQLPLLMLLFVVFVFGMSIKISISSLT